jgi:hypothetical protein
MDHPPLKRLSVIAAKNALVMQKCLEVVSKPPLRPNFCVGPRDSILEKLNIFLRLNPSPRLDFEPD